jgi:hypothetical protein
MSRMGNCPRHVDDGYVYYAGLRRDAAVSEIGEDVISALIEEYPSSFDYGAFGTQTQAKYEEFVSKLNAAGVARLSAEFKRQYTELLRTN